MADLAIALHRRINDSWLALNCGVTQASLSLSRSRGAIPKFDTVDKMAEVLGVTPYQLYSGQSRVRPIDYELSEQVARLPHFSDLASYLIKMDASQLLELVHDAKLIYGPSTGH